MSPSFAWCLFHVWEVEESKNILSPGSALSLTGRGPFSAHPRVSLDFEGYEKYNNAVWFFSFFFSDGSWCICILLSPGIHLFVNHSNNWSQSSSQRSYVGRCCGGCHQQRSEPDYLHDQIQRISTWFQENFPISLAHTQHYSQHNLHSRWWEPTRSINACGTRWPAIFPRFSMESCNFYQDSKTSITVVNCVFLFRETQYG